MFPQSELDNYKLQVELLQEKLKRSEEHRQQLQEKFEGIMRRRSEHEKLLKMQSRLKYKEFLDEQRVRNERNKTLVRALENIDQQAATLAARSERLKILKMQYELYFGKGIQPQCPTRPLHPNYYYPASMIPMNRLNFGGNSNPQRIEGMFIPQNNVGNFENIPEFGSYLFPATNTPTNNSDFLNEPIVSNQSGIQQRQVNLKTTFVDPIGSVRTTSQDLPNQRNVFADFRNPIDLNRYEIPDSKPKDPHVYSNDGKSGTDTIFESDRRQRQQQQQQQEQPRRQNLNEAQGSSESYSDIEYIPRILLPQKEPSSEANPEYQPLTSDKLHPIKRDSTLERLVAKVNDNASKTDNSPGEGEKSQSMSSVQSKNMSTLPAESKMVMDGTESMLSALEIAEMGIEEATLNKKDPVLWNFGGRIDKSEPGYAPQIKRKEKLSIETIENAIYGERISPSSTIAGLDKLEKIFSDSVRIETHEEKSDMSEKLKEAEDACQNSKGISLSEAVGQDRDPTGNELHQDYMENQASLAAYDQSAVYENTMPNEQNEYSDTAQPEYQAQEDSNQPVQYDYSQFQNQEYQYQDPNYSDNSQNQNYSQNPDPNYLPNQGLSYTQNHDPNYSENQESNYLPNQDLSYTQNQDLAYTQDSDPNYIPNQDSNYAQNQQYVPEYQQEQYQPTEYDQSQDSQQYDPNDYPYNYDQTAEGGLDSTVQQFSQPQYDQQAYSETNYQQGDYSEADYQQQEQQQQLQPEEYETENITSTSALQEQSEISGEDLAQESPEHDASTPQNNIESVVQPSSKPQSPPSASNNGNKPTSILSTAEKPHDSPITGKNKKKKRVNFIDSESEESSSVSKINPSVTSINDESDFDFSTS